MKKFASQKFRLVFILFSAFIILGSASLFAKQGPVAPHAPLPPPPDLRIVHPNANPARTTTQRRAFDDNAFEDQKIKSENFLMQNLNLPGIHSGVVVASPSRTAPNYFYHWIRDAAISFMQVQSFYLREAGAPRASLQSWMLAHMSLNLSFQAIPNLMAGDGEPKFNYDGTAFQGPWGRPQTDGPALRAISFIYFLNSVVKENWPNRDQIVSRLYDSKLPTQSLIKTDLEYVAHHWNQASFDLWEEAFGAHFFTLMAQRRAMIEGARLAQKFGDSGASQFYAQQAQLMAQALQGFWSQNANYTVTSLNVQSGPRKVSLLDSSVLLAALYGDVGDGFYAPYDDRILATLQVLKETFQKEYPINRDPNAGIAIGRYPEDTYDGVSTNGIGNAWFIGSQSAAEVYYRTALHLAQVRQVQINPVNIRFYNSLMQGQTIFKLGQVITMNDPILQKMVQTLVLEGDRELEVTILHRGSDGSLSEQINRGNGFMQGAVNLTWSHASYLSAMLWRTFVRGQL